MLLAVTFVCAAQQTPVSEPVTDDSQDAAAMSDGLFDKSRPLFRVGDDEVSDSQLTSAAETVIQDVIKADVQPSQAVSEPTDPGDAVKLSTPKCQQLDSAANVTTPPMHKSASKYVISVNLQMSRQHRCTRVLQSM